MSLFHWSEEALALSASRRKAKKEEMMFEDSTDGENEIVGSLPQPIPTNSTTLKPMMAEYSLRPTCAKTTSLHSKRGPAFNLLPPHDGCGDPLVRCSEETENDPSTITDALNTSPPLPTDPKNEFSANLSPIPLMPTEKRCLVPEDLDQNIGIDRFTLSKEHFRKLLDGDWLSTDVLEGFIFRVNERSRNRNLKHFAVSPYFFQKLRPKQKETKKRVYKYSEVKNWLWQRRRVDITTLDSVFVPILFRTNHWIMIVLDFTDMKVVYYDPMSYSTARRGSDIIGPLKRWVRDEVKARKGESYAKENFKNKSWDDVFDASFPKQEDSSSCGVFVLHVLEILTRQSFRKHRHAFNIKPMFSQSDNQLLRDRIAYYIKKGF